MGQNKIYNAIHLHVILPPQDNLTEQDMIKWILSALIDQCDFKSEAIRLKKKKPIVEKELQQSFVFEMEILTPPNLTEEDILGLIQEAFIEHCNFTEFTIEKKAFHKTVVVDVEDPPVS